MRQTIASALLLLAAILGVGGFMLYVVSGIMKMHRTRSLFNWQLMQHEDTSSETQIDKYGAGLIVPAIILGATSMVLQY